MESDAFTFKTSLAEEKSRWESSPYSKRPYANAYCFQFYWKRILLLFDFTFSLKMIVERSKGRCLLTLTFIVESIVFS